jgi:hypothetical protein
MPTAERASMRWRRRPRNERLRLRTIVRDPYRAVVTILNGILSPADGKSCIIVGNIGQPISAFRRL